MTFLILICTLPERGAKLRRLTDELDRQKRAFPGLVDYKCHDAGKSMSTGQKRNQLIEQSTSEYFSFIDDDDMVSPEYISSILQATESNPDVITFNGWYTEYGMNKRLFTIRLGSKYYEDPKDKNFYYYRFPNHLAVFKRDKVRHIKFPHIWQQEDFQWADRIRQMDILKTEVHIPKMLYHYDCHPKSISARIRR